MKKNFQLSTFNVKRHGFTLVETLVAISILTIAVAGPLYTANRAIVAVQISRDQLTASYLAQEGVEYVRSMRDNLYLIERADLNPSASRVAWDRFLNGNHRASITQCRAQTCTLDVTRPMGTGSDRSLEVCSACQPLHLRTSDGIYTQLTGAETRVTPFTRTVRVVDLVGTSDLPGAPYPDKRVESVVSWTSRGTTRSVTIHSHLTPWQ